MTLTPIIPLSRSIIIAADVPFRQLESLVQNTCTIPGIGGYKIGFMLALEQSLSRVVSCIKKHTQLPIIYDHQKAGNDIPAMGEQFARICKESGVDAVILFPFTGTLVVQAWIQACQRFHLNVMVGAHMTHEQFFYSQGGSIADDAPERIFKIAAQAGLRHFVVPGNQPEAVKHYYQLLTQWIGDRDICLYAPGFITQKGKIEEFAAVAGHYFHPIVGSAIYNASSPHETAKQLAALLESADLCFHGCNSS